jgi:4-amino-4-deoxy-L-arabinose transferase-like glycosyltransferase
MTAGKGLDQVAAGTGDAPPPRPLNPRRHWLAFALIITGALAMTLYKLGACGVCKGNEAVEAVFIQQMVERGRLLFPSVNGGSPMYKPPLFHWSAVALDRLMGVHKVTAFNFRLPAALYATAGVALTMGFAYGELSIDGAILAGLSLLSAHQYIRLGRFGRVDMTLTFFETLSLFAFWWWFEKLPENGHDERGSARGNAMLYLVGLSMGLGVLTKGPVGAILPGLSMVIFLVLEGRFRETLRRITPGPVVVAMLLGVSWYVAGFIAARHALLARQVGSENFGRFFGTLGRMPPWFYLGPLLFSSFPMSLLVPFGVYHALFRREGRQTGEESGERAAQATRLLAIFWVVTLVFFSVAAYKSRWYLLPLWPSAAVILAWWLKIVGKRYGRRIIEEGFAAVCVAVAAFNLFFIPHQEMRDCARSSYRSAAEEIRRLVGPGQPLYAAGFADEGFAPLLFYLDRDVPFISPKLADAPPGYIIVPAKLWNEQKGRADGLEPIFESSQGRRKPVLLRHRVDIPVSSRRTATVLG